MGSRRAAEPDDLRRLVKEKVANAPGYATFSAVNINVLLLATARGTGLLVNNETDEETYMKVLSLGGGLGAGIKDLSILIVFNEHDALDKFVNSGWQAGASADAAPCQLLLR